MLKKTFLSFLLLQSVALYSAQKETLPNINYGTLPSVDNGFYSSFNLDVWLLGGYAFNFAPELTTYFALLKRNYKIDTVVETGTFKGGTTVLFSCLFNQVHTIEIEPNTYNNAKKLLSPYSNVQCHFGSSEVVLDNLLPGLKQKPILLYLDAHWNEHWPLLNELEAISKTHKDNCIIVIDDFKVPNRPDIPYDHYGIHECSYEYIKEALDKVYSSYRLQYVIPRNINSRAKLAIFPASWPIKRNQEEFILEGESFYGER